jgi:hypothetical protein
MDIDIPETNDFCKRMTEIAGNVFSYKQHGEAVWKVGRQTFNKHKLIKRMNQPYHRHCKIAQKHFRNVQPNFKISNNPNSTKHCIYIDYDIKRGQGTVDDVNRFFKFLTENGFSHLPKPIINANGGGAILLVDCLVSRNHLGIIKTVDDETWNKTVKAFGKQLEAIAISLGCQFSEVAAYGTIPVPVYDKHFKDVVNLKFDDKFLFKCPPDDSWIKTSVPFSSLTDFIDGQLPLKLDIQNVSDDKQKSRVGSTFEKAAERVERIYKAIMHDNTRPVSVKCGRKTRNITARMTAEYIYAITCLKPNPDGTMPHRRVGGFISFMYREGVFQHGYDPTVLSTVRDYMSSKGICDWEDNTYARGSACKWQINQQFKDDVKNDTLSLNLVSTTYTGQSLKPVFREEQELPANWQEVVDELSTQWEYKMAA